jgi:hypothetical protein
MEGQMMQDEVFSHAEGVQVAGVQEDDATLALHSIFRWQELMY